MSKRKSSENSLVALDAIDRRILSVLQKRADIPNNLLADEIGLTPGPCLRRVNHLRETGILQHYTVVQNNSALGYKLGSFAEITLNNHTHEVAQRFVKSMTARREVLGCHMVTGDFDFMLRIATRDLEEYRKLIWEIHGRHDVAKVRSTFMLETFKDELNVAL